MKIIRVIFIIFLSIFPMISIANESWQLLEYKTVDQYRILNGEIEAVNRATVSSQTTGRVSKLNYDVDNFVSEGSVLVEFTNTEQKLQLNQAIENAKAIKIAYEQAQTDYQRIEDVFAKKLVSKSQLDEALSNRNALKAKFAAAESAVKSAQEQLEYTIIRAPYDGIVTKRFVEIGELVNPGTAIMEGLSLSQLRVSTHIPESIINQIKANLNGVIILKNGTEIKAKNITIFPYADQSTHTFQTRLDIDLSQDQLFPGMSVKVKFKIAEKQALYVPQSAIVTRSELTMVYVLEGEKALPRQVKLGSEYENQIEVISGLKVNEKIIISPLKL